MPERAVAQLELWCVPPPSYFPGAAADGWPALGTLSCERGQMPLLGGGDALDLLDEAVERRDVEVALEQRRVHAEDLVGAIQQRPHRIDHIFAVGVDRQILGLPPVTGDMHVDH